MPNCAANLQSGIYTYTYTHLHFHHSDREALLSSRLDTLDCGTNCWDSLQIIKNTVISFISSSVHLKLAIQQNYQCYCP